MDSSPGKRKRDASSSKNVAGIGGQWSGLDRILEGVQVIGPDWRYLYLNDAAAGHGRRCRDELIGRTMMEAYPGIEESEMFRRLRQCMETRAADHMENEFTFPDGGKAWFELRMDPVPEGVCVLSLDITERKQADRRNEHLMAVLRALRDVNKLITREKSRERLVQQACDLMVATRGYERAWIMLLDSVGRPRSIVGEGLGGETAGFFAQMMAGSYPACVRELLDQAQPSLAWDCRGRQHADCIQMAAHASCGVFRCRLEHEGRLYGVLGVTTSAEQASDPEESGLFGELCGDVAFALASIEREEELWQSEALFRALAGSSPVGIYIIQNRRFAYVNSRFSEIIGYSREELLAAEGALGYVHPDDRPGVRDNAIRSLKGVSFAYEYRIICQSGETKWILETVASIQYRGQRATLGNFMDITERKKAERELRESEEKYRSLVENTVDIIFMINKENRVLSVNTAAARFLRKSPEEIAGKMIFDIFQPKLAERYANNLRHIFNTGISQVYESLVNMDDTDIWLSTTLSPVRDLGNQVVSIIGVAKDVTESKQAEAALRASEANFRNSLDNSPLGIFIVTLDNEILYANQAMLDIYGYSSTEELRSTPDGERSTPESYARFVERTEKRKRGEALPNRYETDIIRKDGQIRNIEAMRSKVVWNGQERYQVIHQDITERKRMQAALRDSEANFRSSLENSPYAIIIVASHGDIVYANQAVVDIYGYDSIEELKSTPIQKRLTPESYQEFLAREAMGNRGEPSPTRFYAGIVRKDGEVRQVEVARRGITWDGQSLNMVIYNDVTERKQAEAALRRSEDNFRRSLDESLLGIRIVDGLGKTFYGNRAFLDIFGYDSLEELLAVPARQRFTAEDYARQLQRMEKRKRGEYVPSTYEHTVVRKDGQTRNVKLLRKDILWDGWILNQIIFQDVTEQKQAEAALRESEANFRNSLESSPLGIRIVTADSQVIYANRAMLDLYGYDSGEELRSTPVSEHLTPESYAQFLQRKERRQHGAPVLERYNTAIVRKDGLTREIEAIRREIAWNGEKQYLTIYQDVTDRKRAEERLRASEEKLRLMFESITAGVAVVDLDARLVEANNALLRMYGYHSKSELIGLRVFDLVAAKDHARVRQYMAKALREGPVRNFECSCLAGGGKEFPAEVNAAVLRDAAGNPFGFIVIVDDITERQRAEKERLELERKAQNASRLASVGEMAAGIAHEINNPLTPVLGFTEMLMKRDLPEEIKADLQVVHDSTRRTADVVRRLLAFARQSKPLRTLCNINEVVSSTLQLRAYHLKTNSIEVTSELDTELPRTMADAGQMQQVLLNLIMNAEYEMSRAHGRGNLLVKTEKTGDIIRVSVTDDGQGISKENMEKLFTPFFTTKKVGEGTGLGLSVCHGIVAEHSGRIYAESQVGKGTTFYVELPVIRQEKVEEEEAKLPEPEAGQAGEAIKARILVVDDEPSIMEVLKRVLTNEGYEVKASGEAKEALRLIESEKYALILLDIKLPGMSGIELYQHLEGTANPLARRIIFITGDVLGADTKDFFARTGACCITKPFDIDQLKKEVKSRLLQCP